MSSQKNPINEKNLALVITGGEAPALKYIESYLKDCHYLVAADSGLERALEYGIRPDLVVGDMDSLTNKKLLESFKAEQIHQFPVDKDYTDTELALKEIEGYRKKILIGGGEGRLDHTLALLALFEGSQRPDIWITGREEIFLIEESCELEGTTGELISFYPVGDRDISYRTEGLKWPLDGVRWKRGELSLSNRFDRSQVSLIRERGRLLVIRTLPGLQA